MSSDGFNVYELHYRRMGNVRPDWLAAERFPERYACRKPWLDLPKTARILDFGCGWGQQLLGLWCAGYRNIEGVELVPEQARLANESSQGRISVHCMDGRQFLAGRPEAYDLVILNDVLEHIAVSDAVALLVQIRDSLVPGGRIVIRVPNMASLLASYSRYLDITHVAGYTEFSLMQALDQAGFQNHFLLDDRPRFEWKAWRPLAPWRGFQLRARLNVLLHKVVYALRSQTPSPQSFGCNLEMYSHKPTMV
ncbi:MAG: class I SAM-dependent methyltransferase [Thermoguttaceae bacterium]